ncbi:MAG TPA: hypothetical protein VHZ26_02635 [Caulobacteraceae bacterium]|jgi:hypothetical protein|nr:hypothetical protein [Caulobacteraceae bacterium]
MYFQPKEIEELRVGLGEVRPNFEALRDRIVVRQFKTDAAREHADHGLARRLGTMARCIEQVFALLPPDLDASPDRDTTIDATINIQAFVMSAFGCCENIAWIWVRERDVRLPNNNPLPPARVGLGPNYPAVRDSLTPGFRAYLDSRAEWFELLKNFRDALAHRIPLYIPPFTIDPARAADYQALGAAATAALRSHDFKGYEKLLAEQKALTRFQPIMAHSLTGRGVVVFHAQLLADFATTEEMAGVLLDELDR